MLCFLPQLTVFFGGGGGGCGWGLGCGFWVVVGGKCWGGCVFWCVVCGVCLGGVSSGTSVRGGVFCCCIMFLDVVAILWGVWFCLWGGGLI